MNKLKKIFNSFRINYAKYTYWYENNYNMLGSIWLYDALRKLNLKKNFSFLSPSANLGWYESEVYNYFKDEGFNPIFYLGDICSGELKDKVKERDKIFWISGNGTDASQIEIAPSGEGTVPIQFDVILDCKGALWHNLNNKNRNINDVIALLENYYNLLNTDESVLLIDCAIPSLKRKIFNIYIEMYYDIVNIKARKVKMQFMSEYTTFFYLLFYIGRDVTYKSFKTLNIKINNKNFKDNFDIAYCTKKELKLYIEEIKNIDNKEYKKNIRRSRNLDSFYSFCTVFSFVLCLICLVMDIFRKFKNKL